MRVLHFLPGAVHGGAETFATELILSLAKRNIDQVVITRPFRERTERFGAYGVPWRAYSYDRVLSLVFGGPRVRSYVKQYRPDVVQCWMSRAAQILPRITVPSFGWMGGYYDLKRFSTCSHIIGCTDHITKHNIDQGFPAWRTHTINTFAMLDGPRANVGVTRKQFETPERAVVLLAMSRLHKKKAIDTLLRALSKLPEAYYLWIAGDGPCRGELESLAHDLGVMTRVRFLGWRSDRFDLLNQADLCVLPSRYEPFGTVIVEAWQTKTPIVACKAIGPRSHIADRTDGILCNVDDPADLAQGIRDATEDRQLSQRLIENGFQQYKKTYNENAVAQKYMDLYGRIRRFGFPSYLVRPRTAERSQKQFLYAAYRQAAEDIDDTTISKAYFIHRNARRLIVGNRVRILSKMEIEDALRSCIVDRPCLEPRQTYYGGT